MNRTLITLALALALLAGCAPLETAPPPTAMPETPALATATNALTGTPTRAPSQTAAATRTPSPSPSPSPTVTPSPTPEPHPMSIAAQRARAYPGSEIVIVEELARGANYSRYYAYYLSDGLKIYALLTVPDGEVPEGGWPAIVFNHGYIPPDVYRTTERYIAYVDQIARSGYIVFRIDYRGHDRSEGQATGAYGSPGYLVDVMNAVASLKQYDQANPEKIGMWGHSMGGYLTLRAMVISPDIKAGVIWAGVVGSYEDLLYNWRRPGSGPTRTPPPGAVSWRQAWIDTYGTPEENPEFWNSISANAFLADLSNPLQLHHAFGDAEVPYEFSQKLYEQAQAEGAPVDLFLYEGDDHNLSGSFNTAMARTLEFYDSILK